MKNIPSLQHGLHFQTRFQLSGEYLAHTVVLMIVDQKVHHALLFLSSVQATQKLATT